MSKPIELKNVSKTFRHPMKVWDRVEAVKDFSFSMESGEIVGFVGHNGAGKTTSIKMIMGFIWPTKGEIKVNGKNPGDPEVKKTIGFLPERPYFYSQLTGIELLTYFGKLSGVKGTILRDRSEKLLRRVGLFDDRKRKISDYSKGMLQRIGLAQALINDPRLVIMDEPMSGLDPVGRREVKEIIRSLKKEGKSVIFSSHILADIENLSDRVLIIENGVKKHFGTVPEIIPPDRIRYKIEFNCPNDMKDAAFSLFKGIRVVSDRFVIDCDNLEDFNRKLSAVVEKGYTIHDAGGVLPSLEEIVFTADNKEVKQ
jgi:ABC-2 type transport system ATP-binding protein